MGLDREDPPTGGEGRGSEGGPEGSPIAGKKPDRKIGLFYWPATGLEPEAPPSEGEGGRSEGGPEGSPIAGRSSSAVQVYGKNLRLDVWSGGRWTWRSIFDRCC